MGDEQLASARLPNRIHSVRGQGVTVFNGMAKPVRAPQIGPARFP